MEWKPIKTRPEANANILLLWNDGLVTKSVIQVDYHKEGSGYTITMFHGRTIDVYPTFWDFDPVSPSE